MSVSEENHRSFIAGCRYSGWSSLTAIKGYSSVLQQNTMGEMSDAHRKALQTIYDCCEIPWESLRNLAELIKQNDPEKAIEILSQVDDTGQSYLEREFVGKSLMSLEIAKKEIGTILEQAQKLSTQQQYYIKVIHKNCERVIDVWKEIALHFS